LRRVSPLTLGLATAAIVGSLGHAGTSAAQEPPGQARGLRYLSWPGRAATSEQPSQAAVVAEAEPASRRLRRPNRAIPHGGATAAPREALTPAPGPARRTLTPASAWLRPSSPPPAVEAPPPAPPPPPPPPAAVVRASPPPSPAPVPVPEYLPDQGGQPVPAAVAYPPTDAPAPPSAAVDPMAPRRDAPIFRLQRAETAPPPSTGPEPAPEPRAAPDEEATEPRRIATVAPNPSDRPPLESARYYSVHRLNGRSPDTLELPEPTYVDALAITMTEAPVTPDLAAPDPGPALIRDAQGRVRAQPAAPEGDYQ